VREATQAKLEKVQQFRKEGKTLSEAVKAAGLSVTTYYKAKGSNAKKKVFKIKRREAAARPKQAPADKLMVLIGTPEQIRAYLA